MFLVNPRPLFARIGAQAHSQDTFAGWRRRQVQKGNLRRSPLDLAHTQAATNSDGTILSLLFHKNLGIWKPTFFKGGMKNKSAA
jgi:hypothetical protein